jgi:hypothetical protein
MPSLTLANTIASHPPKILLEVENATFGAGGEGYSDYGDVDLLVVSKRLKVLTTSGAGGYAGKSWPVTPGVTYSFSIDYYRDAFANNASLGIINLGSTDGGGQYHDEYYTTAQTVTGSFIATTSTLYVRFVTPTENDKYNIWDNIIISEAQTY